MKVLRYRGPPVLRSRNFCWSGPASAVLYGAKLDGVLWWLCFLLFTFSCLSLWYRAAKIHTITTANKCITQTTYVWSRVLLNKPLCWAKNLKCFSSKKSSAEKSTCNFQVASTNILVTFHLIPTLDCYLPVHWFGGFYVKLRESQHLGNSTSDHRNENPKTLSTQTTPQNQGKITSETTFGHPKVFFCHCDV